MSERREGEGDPIMGKRIAYEMSAAMKDAQQRFEQ